MCGSHVLNSSRGPRWLPGSSGLTALAEVENDSVLVEIAPEGPSIDIGKVRYGYNHTWNVAFFHSNESATRFNNFTAVFTLTDRGILTEGFHILVEAMDWQGNINSVEKGGAIEKNWWEKVADKLKEFLDIAGAIALRSPHPPPSLFIRAP